MLEKMDLFEEHLTVIQKYFLVICLAFMAISMFLAVIFRYCFNSPLAWTEEVLSQMQGALAFLGIGYCWHYKAHTRVLILHDKLPLKVQYWLDFISNGFIVYCLFRLLFILPKYMKSKNASLTSLPWMNYNVFNCFILFGFLLAVLYIGMDEVRLLNRILNKSTSNTI